MRKRCLHNHMHKRRHLPPASAAGICRCIPLAAGRALGGAFFWLGDVHPRTFYPAAKRSTQAVNRAPPRRKRSTRPATFCPADKRATLRPSKRCTPPPNACVRYPAARATPPRALRIPLPPTAARPRATPPPLSPTVRYLAAFSLLCGFLCNSTNPTT